MVIERLTLTQISRLLSDVIASLDIFKMLIASSQWRRCRNRNSSRASAKDLATSVMSMTWSIQNVDAYEVVSNRVVVTGACESVKSQIFLLKTVFR